MSAARCRWAVAKLAVVSAIAVTCSPAPALAQRQLVDRPAANQGGNNDRIIDAIQKRYHARVVRVADTQVNGRAALELRLLSDQRVWTVIVDAQSGQVLSGG